MVTWRLGFSVPVAVKVKSPQATLASRLNLMFKVPVPSVALTGSTVG